MTQPYPPYPPQAQPGHPTPTYPPQAPPGQWYPAQHSAPPAAQPQPSTPPPPPINLPQGGISAPATTNDPSLVRPTVADLDGRLLLCRPTKLELQVPSTRFRNPDGTPTKADRLTVDVIVLDGPPFPYGGTPAEGKPHTHFADRIPWEIPALYVNQTVLLDQLKGCLEPGKPPMVCGRLGKVPSTKGSPAWKLADATEQEMALANAYVASRQTAQPGYAAPVPPPAPPQMPPPPAQMPPAAPYPPQPAYGQPPAQPQYAPPAPPQPAYAPAGLSAPPAPGYDMAVWMTYTPEQQQQIWAYVQSQQAQAAPPYPQPTH